MFISTISKHMASLTNSFSLRKIRTKHLLRTVAFLLLATIALAACSTPAPTADPLPAETEAPPPTDIPSPTEVPPEPTARPTEEPTDEATAEPTEEAKEPSYSGITPENAADVNYIRTMSPPAGQDTAISAIAYSPVVEEVASLGWSSVVNIWDVASGKIVRSLNGHSTYGQGLQYTPDGSCLVSGAYDYRLFVWDPERPAEMFNRTLNAKITRTPTDGEIVIPVGYPSSRASVITVEGGDTLVELQPTGVALLAAAISPAGDYIAVGDLDGNVVIYNRETFAQVEQIALPKAQAPIIDLEFSPDGSRLAVLLEKATIYMLDTSEWGQVYRKELPGYLADGTFDSAFTPDGSAYIVVGAGPVYILDAADGSTLYTEDLREIVWSVGVNGNGSRFALAMDHGSIHVLGIR